MSLNKRQIYDKSFTGLAFFSVALLSAALIIILAPMIYKGMKAIFFQGTVEYRKMVLAEFGRGDETQINQQISEARQAREKIYILIDEFKQGIDTDSLETKIRDIHQDFGKQLRTKNIDSENSELYRQLRSTSRDIRNTLKDAFESEEQEQAEKLLDEVRTYSNNEYFKNSIASEYFRIAENYRTTIRQIDLGKREIYAESLNEVQEAIRKLFGPRPGEPTPALVQDRYGATRMDMVEKHLQTLIYDEQWVMVAPGEPMQQKLVPRKEKFAGTSIESIFTYIPEHLDELFIPRFTFYWRYFIDESVASYFFGGVGPEILGTLILTVLAVLFAVPLGVTSAAFLVECTSDNIIVKTIRMCINTLAGVPSIVFGLFGLAFFVLYLLPGITQGTHSEACILTASLTLALLILPVIIRASEEAIRAVPQSYREASLAVGASKFRTFMTVTLPAALPGILTGIILSLSRAAGETAPIMFTGAAALASIPKSVFEPTRVLSYGSYVIATSDRIGMMVPHKQYGMIATLIILVLALNITSIIIRSRISKKLRGS